MQDGIFEEKNGNIKTCLLSTCVCVCMSCVAYYMLFIFGRETDDCNALDGDALVSNKFFMSLFKTIVAGAGLFLGPTCITREKWSRAVARRPGRIRSEV